MIMALLLLDIAFYAVHILVTGFNLLGWIPKATRRLHRWCVGITAFCWLGAGLYVGVIGYCPLTDWHWQVKYARGAENLPNSFITLLLNYAGIFPDPAHVDTTVGATFAGIVLLTLILWLRERRTATRL